MADVKIVITLDDQGNAKKIQDFEKAIEGLGKASTSAKTSARSFWGELKSGLIPQFTAGALAANAIRDSFRFLKDQFVETMGAAIEAEKVDRALESSLRIVGQASGGTADTLKRYASALAQKTVYDDEAIKSAQALIIQMRGTASQIDVLTRGAIGLSSVFGMDLQSAARAVAQGMEGNYRAIGMLIPAVREATTEAGKHAAFLSAMADGYQRAEDEAKTFGGRLTDIKKTYNELQESIGNFVIQNKSVVETLSGVKEIIVWLNRYASQPKKEKKGGWDILDVTVIGGVRAALKGLGDAAKQANEDWANSWSGMAEACMAARKTVLDDIPIIIKQKLVLPLTESQKAIREEIRWLRMLGSPNIVAPIKDTFGTLGEIIGGSLGKVVDFQETVPGLFDFMDKGTKNVTDGTTVMAEVWDTAFQGMTARLVSFGDANATVWANIGNVFGGFVQQAIAGLETVWIRQLLVSKSIIKAKQGEATASHIGNIFKALPFPIDLIVAAGAFSVINALFSKILKFERGGVFSRPTIAEIGHGTEYVLPERKLERLIETTVIRERTMATAGGPNIVFGPGAVTINAQRLDDAAIDGAARKLLGAVRGQLRIHGRKI
jgi:hypothetical protein